MAPVYFMLAMLGLLIFIPLIIFWVLYKKGYTKVAWGFLLIVWGFFFYSIFTAIFPNDSFYIQEFEENTLLKFPKSGNIIKKSATFPDQHGTYTAFAVIEFSEQDYSNVLQKLKIDSIFKVDLRTNQDSFFDETSYIIRRLKNKITIKFLGIRKANFTIGFLSDNKTIVFQRIT